MWPLLLLLGLLAASQPSSQPSFLAELDNEAVLKWAELCNEVYLLQPGSNDDMTDALQQRGQIGPQDRVVMQGFRHESQLSSVVIKTGINRFKILFIGTASFLDGLSDVDAIPVSEHSPQNDKCAGESVHDYLRQAHPTHLAIRIKKKHRKHEDDHTRHERIEIHEGFQKAGKDLMARMFEGLKPYIDMERDIVFELSGHSLGGALAAHMAYHIRKRLAKAYHVPSNRVGMKLITFAAAGCFLKSDLARVAEVTDALNTCVHFYRGHDLAREMTEMAGYKNPGHRIFLDNFVSSDGSIADFLQKIEHFEETPWNISERVHEEISNHSIVNYIETITAAIRDQKDVLTSGETDMAVADLNPSGFAFAVIHLENMVGYLWKMLEVDLWKMLKMVTWYFAIMRDREE